jgi:hypothetical protein
MMPPENDGGRPPPGRSAHAEPVAATPPKYSRKPNPPRRQCGPDLSALRRRHAAALRLPPLAPCGCIRDPGHDRHRCGDEITTSMVDGYRAAVLHLRAHGLLAAPDIAAMQALWRRGGDDRQLAQELYELAGGVVA